MTKKYFAQSSIQLLTALFWEKYAFLNIQIFFQSKKVPSFLRVTAMCVDDPGMNSQQ